MKTGFPLWSTKISLNAKKRPRFKLVTASFNVGNELSSNFLTDGNSFHFWHNKSECFLFSLPNQEKINPPKVRPCCKECYLFIFFSRSSWCSSNFNKFMHFYNGGPETKNQGKYFRRSPSLGNDAGKWQPVLTGERRKIAWTTSSTVLF